MFFLVFIPGKREKSWNTIEMPRFDIGSFVISFPSIFISPLSTLSIPLIRDNRVDFPLPLGPRMVTSSPFSTEKERERIKSE